METHFKRKAVFFDRDGVLNEPVMREGLPRSPHRAAELRLTLGAVDALRTLKNRGFLLIVVTNQPEVARGLQDREWVDEVHRWLCRELPLDDVRVCFHDNDDHCECRKPRSGLIRAAASEWGVTAQRSYLIGDRGIDLDAGSGADCCTILLRRAYNAESVQRADYVCDDLAEAARWIVDRECVGEESRREL